MLSSHASTPILRNVARCVVGTLMAVMIAISACALINPHEAYAAPAKWVHQGSTWKYQQSDGSYATGWLKSGGRWYYLDAQGVMQTGWFKDKTNTWYYANGSGVMQTGWLKQGSTWYYLSSSGAMATKWQKIGNTWYYFYNSGAMATGWAHDGKAWYYLDASGAMQTGWLLRGSTWYYLTGSGAAKQNEWLYAGGAWYYFNDTCAMATGWAKAPDNNWYYFSGSGAMQTGWIKSGGAWYYLKGSGVMATNYWAGDYWLGADGKMATNAWVDNGRYYVDASGLWTGWVWYGSNNSSSTNPANAKPKYTYEVYSLKNPQPIYYDFCLYIKTENPNPRTLQIQSRDVQATNVHEYADVAFSSPDNVLDYFEKVPGGYLVEISPTNRYTREYSVGTFEVKLTENDIEAAKFKVTISDFDQAEKKEFDRILSLVTKPGMNSLEKLSAAAQYIQQNWKYNTVYKKYDPNRSSRYAYLLTEKGVWWQSHQLNSYTSPALLCRLAEYIGGFSDIHNCYYDYPDNTPEWQANHYYCRVTYEGKQHYLFACPWTETAHAVDPATEPKVSFTTSGILGAKLN